MFKISFSSYVIMTENNPDGLNQLKTLTALNNIVLIC